MSLLCALRCGVYRKYKWIKWNTDCCFCCYFFSLSLLFCSLVMLFHQNNWGIERTNCLYVRKRGRMNALEVAIFCCAPSSCRRFFFSLYSLRSWLWWLSSFLYGNLLCARISIDSLDGVRMLCLDGQCHRERWCNGYECNRLVIQTKRFLNQQAIQVRFASPVVFIALCIIRISIA